MYSWSFFLYCRKGGAGMSIFPFIEDDDDENEAAEELHLLKEYAFDFEKNELLLDEHGQTYLVEGNEALRIWIYKALTTERGHYTAYSEDYGSDYQEELIGQVVDPEIFKLEMERYIVEALMISEYIESLDNFEFEETTAGLIVSFDCTSVYGTNVIQLPVKEVRL